MSVLKELKDQVMEPGGIRRHMCTFFFNRNQYPGTLSILTYQNQQLELIDITVNTKQVIVEHAWPNAF